MRIKLSVTQRLCVLLLVFSCPISAQDSLQSAPNEDPWENLKHITHLRSYLVVDRDLICVSGVITGVTNGSLTLKADCTSTRITLERSKILRVMEGPTGGAAVYSGKSSWSDIKGLSTQAQVQIVTKRGDRHDGKFVTATDTSMTIFLSAKQADFPKIEIARVYVVRNKPLSDGAELASHGMFDPLFIPELWPYILNVAPKISVILYDSTLPEDNGPTRCKNDPIL